MILSIRAVMDDMSEANAAASINCTGVEVFTGFAVEHRARFAVVQGHRTGPRMGYLKSPCRTSYRSSI